MPNRNAGAPPPSLRARAERLMEERTRSLASRARAGAGQASAGPVLPVLACAVGGEFHALPLGLAVQVVPARPCAPLPGAPAAVLGLLGRAGQVFSVLDLGLALGRPGAAPDSAGGEAAGQDRMLQGHVVLLRHAPRRFALRVDRVLGVAEVAPLAKADQPAAERMVTGHALLPPALRPRSPAPGPAAGAPPPLMGLIDLDRLLQPYLSSPETSGA